MDRFNCINILNKIIDYEPYLDNEEIAALKYAREQVKKSHINYIKGWFKGYKYCEMEIKRKNDKDKH